MLPTGNSTNSPCEQPAWGAYDYVALGATVWMTGKTLHLLLKGAWDKHISGNENPTNSIEDKEFTHAPKDGTISSANALKIMQGKNQALQIEIQRLRQQVSKLQQERELQQETEIKGDDYDSEAEEIAREKEQIHPQTTDSKKTREKSVSGTDSAKRANQIKNEEEYTTTTTTTTSTIQSGGISDSIVEEFISPLYDEEDKAVVFEVLRKALEEHSPDVQLNVLLDAPPPVRATGSTRGRGGPAKKGDKRSNDEALLTRLNVNQTTLQMRRNAFLILHNELVNFIRSSNSEIASIKGKNSEILAKANNFENTRKEDFIKLAIMQKDLENAKTKCASFRSLIEDYQDLLKTDPEAAFRMQIKFSTQVGTETKIVYQSLEQVVEKELLTGYEIDIMRIEDNIKIFIKSMNSDKQKFAGKLYHEKLKYISKELCEDRHISVADALIMEKNIRVAREKLNVIKDNMKIYKVEIPKDKIDVPEELTPVQKETDEKLQKEKQERMQRELQEKIGGIKIGNVSDYSFEFVSDVQNLESYEEMDEISEAEGK